MPVSSVGGAKCHRRSCLGLDNHIHRPSRQQPSALLRFLLPAPSFECISPRFIFFFFSSFFLGRNFRSWEPRGREENLCRRRCLYVLLLCMISSPFFLLFFFSFIYILVFYFVSLFFIVLKFGCDLGNDFRDNFMFDASKPLRLR